MKKYLQFLLFVVFVFIQIQGCHVGPSYKTPEVEIPDQWRIMESISKTSDELTWWKQYKDPTLVALIHSALNENKDLLIAVSRIEEARGYYQAIYGAEFPQFDINGEFERSQVSREEDPAAKPSNVYALGASVFWEVDFWGKLRHASQAAKMEILMAKKAQRVVCLTLVSDVARTYFEIQDLHRRIGITRDTQQIREESLEIAVSRFKGGVTSKLEVHQAESELASTLASLPGLEKQLSVKENALSILQGKNPGAIVIDENLLEFLPTVLPSVLPAALLERRPDILKSQLQLRAAYAQVSIAEAAFYPSLSLSGLIDMVAPKVSSLWSYSATEWEVTVNPTWSLFNGGQLKGKLRERKAQLVQAGLQYEQTVQKAFQEVNDTLLGFSVARRVRRAQEDLVKFNTDYANLAFVMYTNGEVGYLEYLDAKRKLFSAELAHSQAIRDQLTSLVSLYKSLGGGWGSREQELAPEEDI